MIPQDLQDLKDVREVIRLAMEQLGPDVSTTVEVWPEYLHAFQLWYARLAGGRAALVGAAAFINDACSR